MDKGYFTEAGSEKVVLARAAQAPNARLREVMESVVRHLHAVVKEVEPTQEEWMEAILFLTATGHKSTEWRQEFILLSDVLGVSMLVDTIADRKRQGAGTRSSESTVLGPFHVEGAPELPMGADICLDRKGQPMRVHGRILDADGNPVAGARIDVWQANDEGFYDVQQKGLQPDFNLRGVFRTGEDGRYWFRGVKPRFYPIPTDGPVGDLLAGLGREPYRPAHLHYRIDAPGFERLVTHIFDPADRYIAADAVFGVKESLLAEFRPVDDPAAVAEAGMDGPFLDVEFDFVLSRGGERGTPSEAASTW